MTDAYRYKMTYNYRAAYIGEGRFAFLPLPKDVAEFEIECRAIMDGVRDAPGISTDNLAKDTP